MSKKITTKAKESKASKVVKKTPANKVKTTAKKPEVVVENLGLLKVKKTSSLFVGLLPTKYKSVIVSYDRNLNSAKNNDRYYSSLHNSPYRISCLIPPETHNVQMRKETYNYDYDRDPKDEGKLKSVKHHSDNTLLSIEYPDIPKGEVCKQVSIFIINSKTKDAIEAAPYLLPNVTDGYICFGSVGTPKDLRSAHTLFWNSPFNGGSEEGDLDAASNIDYIRRYKSLTEGLHRFEDVTWDICGDKFWSTTQQAEGILITNCQELLKQVPSKFWLRNLANEPLLVVLANSTDDDKWKFWGRNFCFEIEDKHISTPRSENKKLLQVEKKLKAKESQASKEVSKVGAV